MAFDIPVSSSRLRKMNPLAEPVIADAPSKEGDSIWRQPAAKFNGQLVSIRDALHRKLNAWFEAGMSWLGSFSFRS
jgi:hypothetical protein